MPRSRTAATASTARSSTTSRSRSRASPTPTARRSRTRPSARPCPGSPATNAAIETDLLQGVVTYGNRDGGAAAGLAGRRQDGDDRELRRRVVRRLHARPRDGRLGRLPRPADPDADRVPRPAGRRRHLPGADLEGVHGRRRSPYRKLTPTSFPSASIAYASPATGALPRPQARARQRQLPRHDDDRVLHRTGADDGPRTASRTRSRCPNEIGVTLDTARDHLLGQPLLSDGRLQAGAARPAARRRDRADPAQRHALGLRQGEARRRTRR